MNEHSKQDEFTRQSAGALLDEVENVLKLIADDHGLQLQRFPCAHSRDVLPVSFAFAFESADRSGSVPPRMAHDFVVLAKRHGLKPSDLGKIFSYQGAHYCVIGLRRKSFKYPIACEQVDDDKRKRAAFGADTVKALLEVQRLAEDRQGADDA